MDTVSTALLAGLSGLFALLGIRIGHRLAAQSQLRDRLRAAYADFFSSVMTLSDATQIAEADAATGKSRISKLELIDANGKMVMAKRVLELVEADDDFREKIVSIADEAMRMTIPSKEAEAIRQGVANNCDSLFKDLRDKHPQLKVGAG